MLSPSHSNKSKADRKAKRTIIAKGQIPTLTEKYNKAEMLTDLVYVDIANGVSRSDIIQKITTGVYECMERPLAKRTAAFYYTAALDRFAVDTDIEMEKLRNVFYGRYESLFADAVKRGDIFNAKNILDSMARIFGIEKKTPQNAIQINSGQDSGVTINFGFKEKNDN